MVVKPMPLKLHPSTSSGFSLWSVTAALLTTMMSFWCFANLQNSLLPVICKGTWVLKLCWCSVFSQNLLQEHSRPKRTASRLPCAASKSSAVRKAEESKLCELEKDSGNVKKLIKSKNKNILQNFALFISSTHGSTQSLFSKQQQSRQWPLRWMISFWLSLPPSKAKNLTK